MCWKVTSADGDADVCCKNVLELRVVFGRGIDRGKICREPENDVWHAVGTDAYHFYPKEEDVKNQRKLNEVFS